MQKTQLSLLIYYLYLSKILYELLLALLKIRDKYKEIP